MEILEEGVGRAYTRIIENASSKKLRTFFEDYISNEATVGSFPQGVETKPQLMEGYFKVETTKPQSIE